MKVIELKDKLLVQIPEELVDSLELKPGDELELVEADCEHITVKLINGRSRKQAIKRIIESAWPIPDDYKFDREEANSR